MKKRDNSNLKWLEEFAQEGYFDDFSEDHFIKRILREDGDLPDKFQTEIFQICKRDNSNRVKIDAISFYASFSARLSNMLNLFDENDIKKFVEAQLSAGKDKYNEDTFFQAISEITCINYVANIVPESNDIYVEYEPTTNGKKNPEARIISGEKNLDKFRYDIEVKTPVFKGIQLDSNKKYLKVNIPLSDKNRDIVQGMADQYDYNVIWPNFYKIKDFINSAGSKFIEPTSVEDINILFINWTFINPKESKIMEPCALLMNEKNGLLRNNKYHNIVGIDEDMLKKISAIVIYCDNYDSFMGQNLLNAIHSGLCKIIYNNQFCQFVDKSKISNELRIQEVCEEDIKAFEEWGNLKSNNKKDYDDAIVISETCKIVYKNE